MYECRGNKGSLRQLKRLIGRMDSLSVSQAKTEHNNTPYYGMIRLIYRIVRTVQHTHSHLVIPPFRPSVVPPVQRARQRGRRR